MVVRSFSLAAAALALIATAAPAQQGVPYFPQTLLPNQVVGRLSSGPGPTEAISMSALLAALFPSGSGSTSFNVGSMIFNGALSGTVTVVPQAVAGNWTLQWPATVGVSNACLLESVSGAIATTSWSAACALVGANNAFTGANTFAGNSTFNAPANFTSAFQIGGAAQTFPASGNIVGTSDAQTLTNKAIAASEVNSGTLGTARMPAFTGDCSTSAGATALTCTKAQGNAISYININLPTVNFNAANTDTSVAIPAGPNGAFFIAQTVVYNCTASITTATFGLFTAAAGGGTSLTATTTGANTAAGPNVANSTQFVSGSNNFWLTQAAIFFRTIVAQGTAVTCSVSIRVQYL